MAMKIHFQHTETIPVMPSVTMVSKYYAAKKQPLCNPQRTSQLQPIKQRAEMNWISLNVPQQSDVRAQLGCRLFSEGFNIILPINTRKAVSDPMVALSK